MELNSKAVGGQVLADEKRRTGTDLTFAKCAFNEL